MTVELFKQYRPRPYAPIGDGEGAPGTPGGTGDPGTPGTPPPAPPAKPAKFTPPAGQILVSKEEFDTMRSNMDALLEGRSFDELRAGIQANADALKTEKERAETERKRNENRLKEAEDARTAAEVKYQKSLVHRALKDAAIPKAYSAASADLVVELLAKNAKIQQVDGIDIVRVEMEVVKDGVPGKTLLTPEDAVTIIESQKEKYGPLFKSGVSGGGGGSASDVKTTPGGVPDVAGMSMPDYIEWRKKNPGAVNY